MSLTQRALDLASRIASEVKKKQDKSPVALEILRGGLAQAENRPVYTVTAGSSTMAGASATWPGSSFRAYLLNFLQAAYPSGHLNETESLLLSDNYAAPPTAPGVHQLNNATTGASSANYFNITARTQAASLSPVAYFHMVGSNDYAGGVAPATYKANLQTVLSDLRTKTAGRSINILIHQQSRKDITSPAYAWSLYGDVLKQLAAESPDDTVFIDANAEFSLIGYPASDPFGFQSPDNVHMLESGHRYLSRVVADKLQLDVPRNPDFQVIDRFNRADAASLGTADTGQAWSVLAGSASVSARRASVTNGTLSVDARLYDVDACAVNIISNGGTGGLVARMVDDSNRFYLACNFPSQTVIFYKTVAGALTVINTVSKSLVVGQRVSLRLVCVGDRVTAYADGAAVGSYTMTTAEVAAFALANKAGLRSSVNACYFDSFAARARP